MIIDCEFSHWKLVFSSPLCKRLPEVTSHKIPLNHHFPMVFLWFSYDFPMENTTRRYFDQPPPGCVPGIRFEPSPLAFRRGPEVPGFGARGGGTWNQRKMTGFRCGKLEKFNSKIQMFGIWCGKELLHSCPWNHQGLVLKNSCFSSDIRVQQGIVAIIFAGHAWWFP